MTTSLMLKEKIKSLLTPKQIGLLVKEAGRQEKSIAGDVEIFVVGDKAIKNLNRRYRGKNNVTDVLSFSWREHAWPLQSKALGQLFICAPQIMRQAKKFGVKPKEEFARMIVHGLLHLAGHNHLKPKEAKIMFGLQEKILKKYDL